MKELRFCRDTDCDFSRQVPLPIRLAQRNPLEVIVARAHKGARHARQREGDPMRMRRIPVVPREGQFPPGRRLQGRCRTRNRGQDGAYREAVSRRAMENECGFELKGSASLRVWAAVKARFISRQNLFGGRFSVMRRKGQANASHGRDRQWATM